MLYLLIPFATFVAWSLIGAGVMAYIDMRYAEEHDLPEGSTPFYDWAEDLPVWWMSPVLLWPLYLQDYLARHREGPSWLDRFMGRWSGD